MQKSGKLKRVKEQIFVVGQEEKPHDDILGRKGGKEQCMDGIYAHMCVCVCMYLCVCVCSLC